MEGWGKLITGALIGVAGTVYATNEEFRKRLPGAARDLPVTVRARFTNSVAAAREASAKRRAEILEDLENHGGAETEPRAVTPYPDRPVSPREMTSTDPALGSKDLTGTMPAEAE
ncbi:MAG: hypothetical protein ACR2GU_01900 [Rubrobacteraceae bacterium]